MFSKNYLIIVLFVGSLLSSDTKLKKEMGNKSRFVKGFIIPGLVGTAVIVLSHKTAFLTKASPPRINQISAFNSIFQSELSVEFFANLKLIPFYLVEFEKLSLYNGQIMCAVISGSHGLLAAAACRYGFNRFFPD